MISSDPRLYEYTGLSPEQTLGHQWAKAAHIEDRVSLENLWKKSLATLMPFDSQIRLRSLTGDYRWFRVRALCSFDSSGECEQWYGTFENIDDRGQLETALRGWND